MDEVCQASAVLIFKHGPGTTPTEMQKDGVLEVRDSLLPVMVTGNLELLLLPSHSHIASTIFALMNSLSAASSKCQHYVRQQSECTCTGLTLK